MPQPPLRRADLQAAVDRANQAIRAHLQDLPGFRPATPEQRARHEALVGVYMDAVRTRDAEGIREADEESEPVAA